MKNELVDLVAWSHSFLSEVLENGDAALDLTAGGGRDTLFLARQVGADGQVFSFDIQAEAIEKTSRLLEKENIAFSRYNNHGEELAAAKGGFLLHASHDRIKDFIPGKVKAVIANLGYLPGGDKNLTTRPETTLAALRQATAITEAGGRIAVMVYVGHPGGEGEERTVANFFQDLDETEWQVLKLEPWNRKRPPVLWLAEKGKEKRQPSNLSAIFW